MFSVSFCGRCFVMLSCSWSFCCRIKATKPAFATRHDTVKCFVALCRIPLQELWGNIVSLKFFPLRQQARNPAGTNLAVFRLLVDTSLHHYSFCCHLPDCHSSMFCDELIHFPLCLDRGHSRATTMAPIGDGAFPALPALKMLFQHLTLLAPEQTSPYARRLREWISDVRIFSLTRKLLLHVVETTCRYQLHWWRESEEAGAKYRGPVVWKRARTTSMYHVFGFLDSIIIRRLCKLTISYQAQVTAAESQSFRFSVKIFSGSALAAGPKKFSTLGPISSRQNVTGSASWLAWDKSWN